MLTEAESDLIKRVRAAEQRRCAAIVTADIVMLSKLIDDSLVHAHTIGTVDTKDSYLAGLEERLEFKSVERGELNCRQFGAVVVMTGPLINTVRRQGDTEWIVVNAFLMQVWDCADDGCKLVSFQATRTPMKP